MTDFMHNGRFRWVVIAFLVAGVASLGLLGWQLAETTPVRWCSYAASGSPEIASGCVTVLIKLLEIKDHAVLGLLVIVGITIISLAAVALGVRVGLRGPGGLSADVGADQTVVSDGNSTVTVPTPPSNGE